MQKKFSKFFYPNLCYPEYVYFTFLCVWLRYDKSCDSQTILPLFCRCLKCFLSHLLSFRSRMRKRWPVSLLSAGSIIMTWVASLEIAPKKSNEQKSKRKQIKKQKSFRYIETWNIYHLKIDSTYKI